MNYQEKTQEFIEGRLAVEEEDAFFEALSSDKAIRSDFKESFALELGMLRDASEINPSNRLTGALFASLGIGATVVSNPIRNWLMNNSKPIVSALIATILTTAAFVLSDFRKNVNDVNEPSFTESKQMNLLSTDSLNIYILPQKSEEGLSEKLVSNRKSIDKGITLPNKNYSYLEKEKSISKNTRKSSYDNEKSIKPNLLSKNISLSDTYSQSPVIKRDEFLLSSIKSGKNLDNPLLPSISNGDILDYFSFKITKFSDYVFPSKDLGLSANDNSELRNSAIALLYKLNDNVNIGIEYRRENVYQEFTGIEDGIDINYYQYPSLNSFGFFTTYDLFNVVERGRIYSGINLGGNTAMGILRGNMGLKIDLGKDYYFDFGVQQSYYIFNNAGQYFNSTKTSLYGGLTFEL